MNLFKRVEVIFLLLLAAGGALWVLQDGQEPDEDAKEDAASVGEPAPALLIHRRVLERDADNARLDLDVRFANRAGRRLVLQSPDVKLLTAAGREVPFFFLPFETPPEIASGATQDAQLRFWLAKPDLGQALTLEIAGEKAEVKTAAAFDLQRMKNKEPVAFADADWKM